MVFLSKWVMQILVFMLIGTIVELLLPNKNMKKYVNIVLGLLLLLILTQPILYLFSVDVTSVVSKMEATLFEQDQLLGKTEISLENQKKEIQATQDAYIWNEVASQLKQEANPQLQEQFSIQITDISIDHQDMEEDMGIIFCTVASSDIKNEQADRSVDPIEIEIGKNDEEGEAMNEHEQAVIEKLAEIWGVEKANIHLLWEGGTT